MKSARWILVVMMVVGMTGAAYACDAVKTASADNASNCSSKLASAEKAANCSSKLASAGKNCSSQAKAAMAAKDDCTYCDFVAELKANKTRVTMSTIDTKNGVTVVFAAAGEKDMEVTHAVADKAFKLMSGPAHCAYTRAEMAKKSCGNCVEGMSAFADANIEFGETETGAEAVVTTKNKEQIAKLQHFFASLNPVEEKAGE